MSEPTKRRSSFWRDHPVFLWGSLALMALLLAGAGIIASRVPKYRAEMAMFNAQMTAAERATRDSVLANREKRTQLAMAILQRDIRIRALQQKKVHLAVVLDDSVLELRHGRATLRRAKIQIGQDATVRAPDGRTWRLVRPVGERRVAEKQQSPVYTVPEWVYVQKGLPIPPEAERRVAGGLGTYVIRLDDGTEIHTEPQRGPLAGQVKAASFQARARDMGAIFGAVRDEMPVYIY
jgi:L,D-transpeptidase YbiS